LQTQQKLEWTTVTLTDNNGKSVPFGAAQNAPQRGSNIPICMSNLGTAPLKAVYRDRGQLLYLVTNDARDWFNDGTKLSSIRLVRLFVGEFPKVFPLGSSDYIDRVFGMNNIYDDNTRVDHMFYGWPALEVNDNGDMVIVYARSGKTIYPEVRFSTYYDNEPDIRPSRLLHSGEGVYHYSNPDKCGYRWGDLAGAALDPADEASVWIVQQYATQNGGYSIWFGKVTP
jgi:hypothetical protein